MLVEIRNRTLSIIWRYNKVKSKKRNYENLDVTQTTCLVKDGIGKGAEIVVQGIATQSPLDPFCKNCGRRFSLQRAIDALTEQQNLTKEERTAFWDGYKDMRNGKW